MVVRYPQAACGFLTEPEARSTVPLVRLRTLTEAECYARCYGEGDDNVRTVRLEPRRPRFDVGVSGEELRQAFESRLDEREHVVEPNGQPDTEVAGGHEPAAAA
jgi:hypothetical protein